MDISTKEVITYNHYDHLSVNKFPEITDEIYERDILVKTSTYEETKKTLQRVINSESNYDKQFFFLSGYAGNGKTAFVNWFKKEVESENFYFEIINLIESPQRMSNQSKLIKRCIIKKMMDEDRLKMKKTFLFIQTNREIFINAFNTQQLNTISTLAQSTEMFKEEIKNKLDNDDFDFTNILTLYLFHKVQQFKDEDSLKSKKSYTFCFDNLDELALEYLTENVWFEFSNTVAHLYDIADNIQCDFIRRKIYFILVFREANFACRSAQTMERIDNMSGRKRFIYSTEGQQILEKRKHFIKKHNVVTTNNVISDLVNIMCKEEKINTIILPLLNYDFRTFSNSLFDILDPDNKFIKLSESEYDKLSDFPFGRRGIIINAYINYLAHKGFLYRITMPIKKHKYKFKNGGHWNIARLVLTVFSNLSFPDGYPEREQELREIPPQPFDLLTAYNELKLFLNPDQFFSVLEELTDMTKFHWAHLITIYNNRPLINDANRGYSFDFSKEKLLLSQSENRNLSPHERNHLTNIKITLNASSYIYLRHIFTHFEFISAYKVNYDLEIIKPLFQCTGVTTRKKNIEIDNNETDSNKEFIEETEVIFEFQKRIEEVYNHVEIMCFNVREYFQKNFIEQNISRKEYIQSNYVFKGDTNRKVLFFETRLLSTHIQYIEKFRHYVRTNYPTIIANASSYPVLKNKFNTIDKIDNYFFEYLEKYIILLSNAKDPHIGQVPDRLSQKLQQAKNKPEIIIEA